MRRRASSFGVCIGAATAFVAFAAALSFGDETGRRAPALHLRGTIAPDSDPAQDPRLPGAVKRA